MASIRSELNGSNLQRLADLLGGIDVGELLTLVVKTASPTESALVPSSSVITLAAVPSAVFQVNVTAGTVTGIKTLQKGVVATALPATGFAVWEPGTTKIKLASADGATMVNVLYAVAADKASALEATLEP